MQQQLITCVFIICILSHMENRRKFFVYEIHRPGFKRQIREPYAHRSVNDVEHEGSIKK